MGREDSNRNLGTVNIDEVFNEPWSRRSPDVRAKHASEADVEIHLSPSGSDSNDGSLSNPVASPAEALSRAAKNNHYDVRIWVDYGDYTALGNLRLENIYQSPDGVSFEIVGHRSDNPFYDSNNSVSDVRFPYFLISGVYGTEEVIIEGINFEDVVQVYNAHIWFKACNWENGGAGNNQCLDVKKAGHVQCSGCDFTSAGRVLQANNGGVATLVDCTASNISGTPISANVGAIVGLNNSDSIITASSQDPSVGEGSLLIGDPAGIKHNRAAGGAISTTTNQTLDHNTQTTVQFDTTEFDNDESGFIDLTNNQITIQRDGVYRVEGLIAWNDISALTNVYLEADIAVNDNSLFPRGRVTTSRANDVLETMEVSAVIDATANDDITLRGRHRNGSQVTDAILAGTLEVTQES